MLMSLSTKIEYFSAEQYTWQPVTNPINGTQILHVPNVQAIRIHTECAPATGTNFEYGSGSGWNVTAVLGDSCTSQPLANDVQDGFWTGGFSPVTPSCITAINSTVQNPPNLSVSQYPIATLFIGNQTAISAAFCYATYEMYTLTAELDVVSFQMIPQVQDASLVQGYFFGQNYLFAPTGFVHGFLWWYPLVERILFRFGNTTIDEALEYVFIDAFLERARSDRNGIAFGRDVANATLFNSTMVAELMRDVYVSIYHRQNDVPG
jgi:hypothetical protein